MTISILYYLQKNTVSFSVFSIFWRPHYSDRIAWHSWQHPEHLSTSVQDNEKLFQQSPHCSQHFRQVTSKETKTCFKLVFLFSFHITFAIMEVIRTEFEDLYTMIPSHKYFFPLFHYPLYRWLFID